MGFRGGRKSSPIRYRSAARVDSHQGSWSGRRRSPGSQPVGCSGAGGGEIRSERSRFWLPFPPPRAPAAIWAVEEPSAHCDPVCGRVPAAYRQKRAGARSVPAISSHVKQPGCYPLCRRDSAQRSTALLRRPAGGMGGWRIGKGGHQRCGGSPSSRPCSRAAPPLRGWSLGWAAQKWPGGTELDPDQSMHVHNPPKACTGLGGGRWHNHRYGHRVHIGRGRPNDQAKGTACSLTPGAVWSIVPRPHPTSTFTTNLNSLPLFTPVCKKPRCPLHSSSRR